MLKLALKVNDMDNVATLFAQDVTGQIEVRDKKGNIELIKTDEKIPYGHKVALYDIAAGQPIVKYGEEIGMASKNIKKGDYVHVHNLESMRGRGDL